MHWTINSNTVKRSIKISHSHGVQCIVHTVLPCTAVRICLVDDICNGALWEFRIMKCDVQYAADRHSVTMNNSTMFSFRINRPIVFLYGQYQSVAFKKHEQIAVGFLFRQLLRSHWYEWHRVKAPTMTHISKCSCEGAMNQKLVCFVCFVCLNRVCWVNKKVYAKHLQRNERVKKKWICWIVA